MAKTDLDKLTMNIKKAILAMPRQVGTEAVNFALDNFKRRGFQGYTFQPWRKLKNGKPATLIKTGHGRRSIRVLRASNDQVVVGSNLPYMKAHNDGFRGTVKVKAHESMLTKKMSVYSGKTTKSGKPGMKTVSKKVGTAQVKEHSRRINMPQRQFLGNSPVLTERILRRLGAMIMAAAKQ